MRILLTGAAGSIGRVASPGLTALGHEVVGLDLVAEPAGWSGVWHSVDCSDPDAVEEAVAAQTVDAVVHLAGIPGERGLEESLRSHVVTTGALLDACVRHRIGRFVYASSNHAVGRTPRPADPEEHLEVTTRPRPDTFYGVGKVAAEALLSLYADRYDLDAIACRIGSFLDRPTTRRHLSTWLSPADGVRMLQAALEAPPPGFAVCYGISANTRAWWSLEPGRALGYHPEDDAERFAAEITRTPPGPDDDAESAYVGGPFATPAAERPAF